MASLPNLRLAKKNLGLPVQNQHLLALSKSSNSATQQDIIQVLNDADLDYDADDISNLLKILVAANGFSDESAKPKKAEQVEIAPEPVEIEVLGVAVEEPMTIAEEEVGIEEEIEEGLDLADYSEIDLFAEVKKVQTLEIELTDTNAKIVRWKSVGGKCSAYVLAANASDFPRIVRDSQLTWVTKKNELYIDTDLRFFTLFVFSKAGEKGATLGRGRVLGEITDLQMEAYEDQVRLRWELDDDAARVSAYRSDADKALPANPSAKNRLPIKDGSNSYIDFDVKQGQEFEYLVALEWEGPDGRIIPSKGKRSVISVPGQISNITGFKVSKVETSSAHVNIEYDRPELGSAKVYQIMGHPSSELLRAQSGQTEVESSRLNDDDVMAWLGSEVIDLPSQVDSKFVISNVPMLTGDLGARTYTIVGILGKKARIIDVKVIQQVGDIDHANLVDRYDYQLLRVALPSGAQALEVWLKSPTGNAEIISSELGRPDRTVLIDEEYRRFGGVIFANSVPGLPNISSLQPEPLSIFVRGISTFDGVKHEGAIYKVEYSGRIAVSFRRGNGLRQVEQQKQRGRSLFRRDEGTSINLNQDQLQIRSSTPNSMNGLPLDLMYYAAPEYPLDAATRGSVKKPFIRIQSATFADWNPVGVGGQNQSQQPIVLEPNLQFRLASAINEISGTPIFTIDNRVDSHVAQPLAESKANETLSIVLVGAKQSGKTTYVQALLNYLEQQLSQTLRARLTLADESDQISRQRLQDMKNFIKTGRLPDATRSARPYVSGSNPNTTDAADPTKQLKFKFTNGGDVPLAEISLVDVAGEDMDSLDTMYFYEEQLLSADLIIFLMDPLQLSTVRKSLSGKPLPPQGTDPFQVMENLVSILKSNITARNSNQKIAVTLSKFDSFEELTRIPGSPIEGKIQNGMQITRDPNSNAEYLYNNVDGYLVQEEILALLERLNEITFTTLVKNSFDLGSYRFFVVSSLGHATFAAKMDSAGLTSYRVSDPIRWALHRN